MDMQQCREDYPLLFLIGKGNNGGDGLAVARILYHAGYNCSVSMTFDKEQLTEECRYNLDRLPSGVANSGLENISGDTVIIDSLLVRE